MLPSRVCALKFMARICAHMADFNMAVGPFDRRLDIRARRSKKWRPSCSRRHATLVPLNSAGRPRYLAASWILRYGLAPSVRFKWRKYPFLMRLHVVMFSDFEDSGTQI